MSFVTRPSVQQADLPVVAEHRHASARCIYTARAPPIYAVLFRLVQFWKPCFQPSLSCLCSFYSLSVRETCSRLQCPRPPVSCVALSPFDTFTNAPPVCSMSHRKFEQPRTGNLGFLPNSRAAGSSQLLELTARQRGGSQLTNCNFVLNLLHHYNKHTHPLLARYSLYARRKAHPHHDAFPRSAYRRCVRAAPVRHGACPGRSAQSSRRGFKDEERPQG